MAGKVRVNGTNYSITGGKCRVNGTNYAIKKGRALVGGTGYDISFANPFSIEIRVISNYYNSTAEVRVNGDLVKTIYYDEGTGEQNDSIVAFTGDEIEVLFTNIGGSYVAFDGCSGFSNFQFYNDNQFVGTVTSEGYVDCTIN